MLILGLGIGFVLIILLWSFLGLFILISKSQTFFFKLTLVLVSAIFTILFILVPQKRLYTISSESISQIYEEEDLLLNRDIDKNFVSRLIIFIVLVISTIFGIGFSVYRNSEPVYAQPLKKMSNSNT